MSHLRNYEAEIRSLKGYISCTFTREFNLDNKLHFEIKGTL